MNKYVHTETTVHSMILLQLGANIEIVSGKMVYVEFKLEKDVTVSYVYHINKKNRYFLERIKPYPLPIKEVESMKEVIEAIMVDYNQFKNAVNSNNIQRFIQTNKRLHKTMKELEDLFLYYNVDESMLVQYDKTIAELEEQIIKESKKAERVFYEKDPDNL
jgi:hypothetical protein